MKKLWNNNRVLFFLLAILCVCLLTIIVVSFSFFYAKNTSKYGDRLNDIAKYEFTEKMKKEYKKETIEKENVKKVKVTTKGRVIYIHLDFDEEITLENAESVANTTLESIDDKVKKYYDINFILESDNFSIIGAKNAHNEYIAWNNNKQIEEEETDEK